ncbi:iron-sulfur cluster-binding domain-containing protein [Actinomycetospora endophytica]|uniref:Iron-sulfur cluster-binding domain-containing protein n=1 Tax=Actinomycetospora endophytica TaxID=2291215 RepID=A0ABS8PHZ1_9PSEU|nr:iron-sulfur cluster-binding domain-containing protein [Actinomycetospora endophytica]MCD2196614.1 iron-sulfur cluster-binding domain-containing protein [Actinomycetospora endophytica]
MITRAPAPGIREPREEAPRRGIARRLARATRALATPLLPDDYLALVNPLWSTRALRGRIVATRPVGHATTELTIRPGAGWAGHRPGQHLGIGVEIGGRRHWRTYSITSAPGDEHLTVSVTAVPDGSVSTFLARTAAPGELLTLGPAIGDFAPEHDGPLLALTGGSGITPILGHLAGGAGTATGADTVVVHSGRGERVHGDDLGRLAASRPRLRVHEHDSGSGRLRPADLDDLVPDWRERTVLVCGPAEMIDEFSAHVAEAGATCLVERFRPPEPVAEGTGGRVTFTASGIVAEADAVTPLLRAGEDAGALLPSGCRMGICHTCVGRLRSGAVLDLQTGELHIADDTTEADDAVVVRTCVSAAAGDCRLDL